MIYLVGAGPGDYGLITNRGLELLRRCDVVIYDRLGTNELLDEVSDNCIKVYVGKQAGAHYRKQEEINKILVEYGKKYDSVVRLKGGDPFVFGRGGEEVMELQKNNIPFQIVPGITSAISVPELLGIPVTHRESGRSFHVFTGHTKGDGNDSISHIHPMDGTSVILMGLSHLSEITNKLLQEGKDKDTPVAVISSGTLPNEKMVKGTLRNIVQKVEEGKLVSPAIIVIGENADFNFVSNDIGALRKKKIGVVGTKKLREKMRYNLEKCGAEIFSLCDMKVVPTDELHKLEQELENIVKYDWIGFTSQNGIKIFFDTVKKLKVDLRNFANIKFAVVGSGTKQALLNEGFVADFMPDEYTTEKMAKGLCDVIKPGEKMLLPRAVRGSSEMIRILDSANIDVNVIPIYDVIGMKTENWRFLNDFDAITFASASGVEGFINALGKDEIKEWNKLRIDNNVKIATIGKVTADALEKYGIKADIVPLQCDVEHMILKLQETWSSATI